MTAPPKITRMIAEFVNRTGYADLPDDVTEMAKRCFVDGLGVMLAGSREPCAEIVRRHVAGIGGVEEAPTLGAGSLYAPAQLAALANGIAGHALDWDDTALSLENDRTVLIHPTMQPLCAVLATGVPRKASGRDLLTAFVIGFEVQVKIAETINADHFVYGRGYHSTGTIGVFGAAAAASKVMGLTEDQTVYALALAATMSSGLGANHGTMAKPLNMGHAAEGGVMAARLASFGYDGPEKALEGERGFFESFGGGHAPEKIVGRLGNPWAILEPGTSIKPYPSGVVGHPGMDAMKALIAKHDLAPEEIERIHVKTGPNVLKPGPLRILHADTALEAKFCVPFQMAAIALRRKAGLAEFSDAFVQSEACQSMQRRVDAVIDPEIAALGKDRVAFEIEIATRDGRTLTGRSEEHYRGGPRNPLTWDEICDKFRDCATPLMSAGDQNTILDYLARLEELDDITRLTDAATA